MRSHGILRCVRRSVVSTKNDKKDVWGPGQAGRGEIFVVFP
jgi:hypothetical protein